jgi:hypothetical protein
MKRTAEIRNEKEGVTLHEVGKSEGYSLIGWYSNTDAATRAKVVWEKSANDKGP